MSLEKQGQFNTIMPNCIDTICRTGDRLKRVGDTGKVAQVMAAVRQRLGAPADMREAKLPSIRAMAKLQGVSASTAAEAYERLAAEGLIRPQAGSGFYPAGQAEPRPLAGAAPQTEREIDPLWVSRQSLDAPPGALMPGCGWLPPSWLPQDAVSTALRALARTGGAALTDYATPLGLPPLRELLARRLMGYGLTTSSTQILLTESGTQAVDLLLRFLAGPGDCVLVDDPCYFNFHALLRAHRVKVASVPYTPDGPDIGAFAQALAEYRPRLYITNSGLHNPTGATLSPAIAHQLLKLAEDARLTIIEDDILADFEHVPAPRLAALDGLNRVIQIGSFSKTLSASIRCGYIAARPDWIDGLTDLKIATGFGGGRLGAEALHSALTSGSYRRHAEMLRRKLAAARREVGAKLRRTGIEPWLEPQGGMFLWCRLPEGCDAAGLARAALAENIVLAPGNVFSLTQSASRFMRFNAAQSLDARLYEFLDAQLRR